MGDGNGRQIYGSEAGLIDEERNLEKKVLMTITFGLQMSEGYYRTEQLLCLDWHDGGEYMEKIKAGIIGTGFIGPAHIEAIRRLGFV